MTDTRTLSFLGSLLNAVPALALLILILGAPLLALSNMTTHQPGVIEAPTAAKKGVGFVLLVTLQRA